MSREFYIAALRHYKDACLLEKNNRLANADQLYGLATECALKFVWSKLHPVGTPKPWGHIDTLWGSLARSPNLLRDIHLKSLLGTYPFLGWSIHQRYDANPNVTRLTIHSKTAAQVMQIAQSYWRAP
ncbi:HEPN domain-containing protein [uncultured Gammaproteobacteria bacterium]